MPENVSEHEVGVDDAGPAVTDETPSLEAGSVASLAVQGLYRWTAKNENQVSLAKGDIIRVSRKCVSFFRSSRVKRMWNCVNRAFRCFKIGRTIGITEKTKATPVGSRRRTSKK